VPPPPPPRANRPPAQVRVHSGERPRTRLGRGPVARAPGRGERHPRAARLQRGEARDRPGHQQHPPGPPRARHQARPLPALPVPGRGREAHCPTRRTLRARPPAHKAARRVRTLRQCHRGLPLRGVPQHRAGGCPPAAPPCPVEGRCGRRYELGRELAAAPDANYFEPR
jgi:hypothetical protein